VRIDIHRPELEALIHERLRTGVYQNVEDVIWEALRSSQRSASTPSPAEEKNLVELSESIRGLLTDEEADTLFSRNPSTGRPVDLG